MREAVVSLKPAVFSNLNAKLKKLGHDAIDTSAHTTGVATPAPSRIKQAATVPANNATAAATGSSSSGGGEGGRETLPYADPLPTDVARKAAPTAALFGEACARCLFSKGWALREAALLHIEHELRKMGSGVDGGVFAQTLDILERALKEKIVHVFHAALGVMRTLAAMASSEQMRSMNTAERFARIIARVAKKLSDKNERIVAATNESLL